MKRNKVDLKIILFPLCLTILLIFLINPFKFWMPDSIQMVILAILVICLAFFFILFWNERASDERESEHIAFSGRFAFLSGGIVLTCGIIIQSLQHNLDPWLPFTLLTMVIIKTLALIYSRIKM